MDQKTRVLFLCTGNSARSQIAEALLRKLGGERYEVFSAGLDPKGIHPLTIQVMNEIGYDLSGQYSKSLSEYVDHRTFDFLITVCGSADKNCPYFPGMGKRLHWGFDDPASETGSEAQILAKFRLVRDQIHQKIAAWVNVEKE